MAILTQTSNPVLGSKTFSGLPTSASSGVMTIDGTVNKAAISIGLTLVAGWISWGRPEFAVMYLPFIIGTLIIAIVLAFKKSWAPALTPVYAVLEGLALGSFSWLVDRAYPGVAAQAIGLTFATLACMLMAYKSGMIKATEKFKLGIIAATGAIMITYLVAFILSLFHVATPFLSGNSAFSIGLSCVVVVIAALNLVLDFDLIESGARSGNAPKYMEWYGAFALLVTLVWLYVEIIRLLTKLKSRD